MCNTFLNTPNRRCSLSRFSNTVISCLGGLFSTPSCLPIPALVLAKPRTGDLLLGVPTGVPMGEFSFEVGREPLGEREMLRVVLIQEAFLARMEDGERAALRYAVWEAILSMCGLPGMCSSGK